MIFHQNYCKNIFRPLFSHFLPNSAILQPPIFSGHGQFFGASFELFGRKFGHLATVIFMVCGRGRCLNGSEGLAGPGNTVPKWGGANVQ
jgi:hypothetical protein